MDLMEDFHSSYHFINNHPAFLGDIFRGVASLDVMVVKCCKHNISEYDITKLYRSDPRFEEFINRGFIENLKSEFREYDSVLVPYKEFYGEKWAFDHVEVWIEGGAHFYGKGEHYGKEWSWNRFHDVDLNTGGNTYEEAIINFANLVKDKYGDFSQCERDDNTIIPSWIVENNINHPAYGKDMFKDGKLNRNPKNINVKDEEINAIWWSKSDGTPSIESSEIIDVTRFFKEENYRQIK